MRDHERRGTNKNAISYVFYSARALVPHARNMDEKLELLRMTSRAAVSLGYFEHSAAAEYEQASLLFGLGRGREARVILERAVVTIPDQPTHHLFIRVLLADVFWSLGNLGDSLVLLDEIDLALQASPETMVWDPARRYSESIRAKVLLDLGLPDQASPLIRRQLQIARELPLDDPDRATSLLGAHVNDIRLSLEIEDYSAVRDRVEEYLSLRELYERNPRQEAQLRVLLALAELETERSRVQDRPLQDSPESPASMILRELLEDEDLPQGLRIDGLCALAEVHLIQGRFADAEGRLKEAKELLVLPDEEGEIPIRQGAKFWTLSSRLALDQGADSSRLQECLKHLEASFESFLAEWNRVPLREGGVGFLQYGQRRALLSELIRLDHAVRGKEKGGERAFFRLMQTQAMGSLVRRVHGEAPNLVEIRRTLLKDSRGLLVYLPGPHRSHVFALDQERLVHEELGSRDEIERVREAYFAALCTPLVDLEDENVKEATIAKERMLARELSRLLLPPLIGEIVDDWTGATVVGADLLGPTPFEWLPLLDSEYLGLSKPVDYLPSIPLGVFLCARSRLREGVDSSTEFALVGEPVSTNPDDPSLPPLILPSNLIKDLEDVYGEGVEFLLGARATVPDLLGLSLTKIDVLQLLVHGIYEPSRERSTGLQLSESKEHRGKLFSRDIASFCEAPGLARWEVPRLVFLTACGSGQGPVRRGDAAAADLGGAFLSAGAQAVLLSHAELFLGPTTELTRYFHRFLKEDRCSPALALSRARVASSADDIRLAPFRCGLLQVVGLGHLPLFAPESSRDGGTESPGSSSPVVWALFVFLGMFLFWLGQTFLKARAR